MVANKISAIKIILKDSLLQFVRNPWKVLIACVFVILGVILSVYVYNSTMQPKVIPESLLIPDETPVVEMTQGITVRQTFQIDHNIDGISLLLATYGRDNNCNYQVEINDIDTGTSIYKGTIEAKKLSDNSYFNILFDRSTVFNIHHKYEILISSKTAVSGNAITIWSSNSDSFKTGELYVNGELKNSDLVFSTLIFNTSHSLLGVFLNRLMLISILFSFLLLHLIFDITKLYEWFFRKRLWIVLFTILFLAINQYNCSSISMYDYLIQNGVGSEYVKPIFGQPRPIRSDEWLVSSPSKLSAQYSGYSEYNEVLRAEKANNLSASGLHLSYSALSRPMDWGYYFFGPVYGFSISWSTTLVLAFFFSFELCLILSNRKKLISLLGAVLITFSGYFMWWSYVNWILSAQAVLVFAYYFMQTDKRYKRILCGIGIAIFGANFVSNLYPAWQVPAGYLCMGILVWMLISNRSKLKAFKRFDWGILIGSLLFLASIIASYLLENREYMATMLNTVYPGKRVSCGGFAIGKLFYYLQMLLYPFRDIGNSSEAGVFLSFFPIPMIMTLIMLIKKKGRDLLSVILLSISILLTIYCVIPLPKAVATALLLTYSMPERLVDIVGFIQIYLLVVCLSRFDGIKKIPSFFAWPIAIVSVEAAVYYCHKAFPTYLSFMELLVIGNCFIVVCVLIMINKSKRIENALLTGLICVSLVSGICINPIQKGLDAIYSKPVSIEIQKVVHSDKSAKWITPDNISDSGFLVASGAPTINSVNYVPNFDLWKKLDPQGQYSDLYNRYAHIDIDLVSTPTSVVLIQADCLILSLSYQDMEKIGVKYIFTRTELVNNEYVSFKQIYNGYGCRIYEAVYPYPA